MAVKRKAEQDLESQSSKKRVEPSDIKDAFRDDLFRSDTVASFQSSYAHSGPYPHAVVHSLIQEQLLRNVRSEITQKIHFTLKETDIYRIHQSGDLANLSHLDQESLRRLPSLVQLRDALYSADFRKWVSSVTGAGALSGQKADMAVNVYTPGSYLLCHDDVIGSRRVSYILYLTDPDHPWRADWGGGLRLYPTEEKETNKKENVKVPLAGWSLNIPPSFGQLSFFAVRPGESYHDVEEVYHRPGATANSNSAQAKDGGERKEKAEAEDGGRIRMAVSGWFHIPQEGEDGYEEGVEQAQAQKSSLAQLQGSANEFDEPQAVFRHFDEPRKVMNAHADGKEVDPGDADDRDDSILTEQDLTFLLQYISPGFLVPDQIEQMSASFEETSVLQLERFLHEKFATQLKEHIVDAEKTSSEDAQESELTDDPSKWSVARPPHKHRFAYLQEQLGVTSTSSPISRLLTDLLHSHAFKKWLALATGLRAAGLTQQHALARRFRRGLDYALANPHRADLPQLEFTISMTPTSGWEQAETEAGAGAGAGNENEHGGKQKQKQENGDCSTNGNKPAETAIQVDLSKRIEFGGEEVYMAGEEEEEEEEEEEDTVSAEVDAESSARTSGKGKGDLPSTGKKPAHDPAVYRSGNNEADDDDGILFTNVASWNKFSVVLRDQGTLRFVKYVSHAAAGDRWDIKGEVKLSEDAFAEEASVGDEDAVENYTGHEFSELSTDDDGERDYTGLEFEESDGLDE